VYASANWWDAAVGVVFSDRGHVAIDAAVEHNSATGAVFAAIVPGVLLVAGVLVPALMLAEFDEISPAAVLLTIVAAYSGVRLAMVSLFGRGRILQLFFWVFAWIFLGLAPMAQSSAQDWPWPGLMPESVVAETALVVLLSFVAYDVGLLVVRRRDAHAIRAPRLELDARRLKVAAVLGVIVCVYQIMRVGPSTLLSDRAGRAAAYSSGGSDNASSAISSALLVSVVFVVGYLFVIAKRRGLIRGYVFTTILLIALTLFVSNPLSSARYRVATVLAGLLLAFIWPISRRQLAIMSLGVLAGLAFLFPLLNSLRKANTVTASEGVLIALRQGDYDAFQQIANTISYVDGNGHTFGHQILSSLLFFVPRSLWQGKGIDTGVLVAQFQEYSFSNLSAPLQAEAYIDGGISLVVVLFVALGCVTGWFERRASNAGALTSYIALIVPIVAAYQVIMLRGSLLQSMSGFVTILVIVALCMKRRDAPDLIVIPPRSRALT
jgi:oligosaccharide repeat unit polymerase